VSARDSGHEVFDAFPDPIIGIDAERRIFAWNRAAAIAYGFSHAEAVGRPVQDLLRTRFPAPLAEILETLADTGGWEGAVVHVDRNGRHVAVESRWSERYDERGRTVGALWIDRERPSPLALAGAEASEPPADRLERLGRVARGVAHDFNNLLAVIVNYSVLVGGELDAAHQSTGDERWALLRNDVGEIRVAAERATHLSRRLVAATRDDDGGHVSLIGEASGPEQPSRS
jgi:PAS domain S-box-containing protein